VQPQIPAENEDILKHVIETIMAVGYTGVLIFLDERFFNIGFISGLASNILVSSVNKAICYSKHGALRGFINCFIISRSSNSSHTNFNCCHSCLRYILVYSTIKYKNLYKIRY